MRTVCCSVFRGHWRLGSSTNRQGRRDSKKKCTTSSIVWLYYWNEFSTIHHCYVNIWIKLQLPPFPTATTRHSTQQIYSHSHNAKENTTNTPTVTSAIAKTYIVKLQSCLIIFLKTHALRRPIRFSVLLYITTSNLDITIPSSTLTQ